MNVKFILKYHKLYINLNLVLTVTNFKFLISTKYKVPSTISMDFIVVQYTIEIYFSNL